MSVRDRTSMELPRELSGSNELMAWPGVASTRTVAACPVPGLWATANPVCAIDEKIAIAVISVRVAGFRSTAFRFIDLNAVTVAPPISNIKTRSSPSKEVSLCEKKETTLPGSFTRNNSIHFDDRMRKSNAKQYGRSFEE